ncbi:class I SAM-dependent methyltransferase [bacterium]|nr:class I SAM-dependent methyltransferase [bacterium]
MPKVKTEQSRLGRGEKGEYYLDYNAKSLTFPRNVFHAPKLKKAAELAAVLPDLARVLDAGCGSGYVSDGLAPRLQLMGVDIEDAAIAFCKEHRKGEFLKADLTKLPFSENTFDLILFTNTIEHLEDPQPVLSELARVLKPRGRLLVTTENCANLFWVFLEHTWYRVFGGPCKPYLREVHPQRYTPCLLKEHLSQHLTVARIHHAVLGMELIAVATKEKVTY